jgi:hypothetical protein
VDYVKIFAIAKTLTEVTMWHDKDNEIRRLTKELVAEVGEDASE